MSYIIDMEKEMKYGSLFSETTPESERERVLEIIRPLGGLSFNIHCDENGWVAQCNQIPGIITGNTNPTPNEEEIRSSIRDAIAAAFTIQEKDFVAESASVFEYSFA